MCTGIEIALIAAAAVGAGATIYQGQQAKEQKEEQAQIAIQQGAQELDAAKARAERIRRAGREQQGQAKAALAASGVKLGEGSALEVTSTIAKRAEEDALTEILSGQRAYDSAARTGSFLRKAGDNAETNSYFSAASTALGAYGATRKSGWASTAQSSSSIAQ